MGIMDQVATMALAERRELAEALRRGSEENLAARYHLGQRWLCRGCRRTFGVRTLSLWGRSKLSASAWMEFAACMADALPLRETVRRVGTSLYTALFTRMRFCEVMGRKLLPLLGESFKIDGTYLHESLPGDHSRGRWFELGAPHWVRGWKGGVRAVRGE